MHGQFKTKNAVCDFLAQWLGGIHRLYFSLRPQPVEPGTVLNVYRQRDDILFKPSPFKALFGLIGSLLFMGAGLWIIDTGDNLGWGVVAFFSFCAVVAGIRLIPNANHLKLSNEGFELRTLFINRFTPWNAVKHFSISDEANTEIVLVHYVNESVRPERSALWLSWNPQAEDALPNHYPIDTAALAARLNEWKTWHHRRPEG